MWLADRLSVMVLLFASQDVFEKVCEGSEMERREVELAGFVCGIGKGGGQKLRMTKLGL